MVSHFFAPAAAILALAAGMAEGAGAASLVLGRRAATRGATREARAPPAAVDVAAVARAADPRLRTAASAKEESEEARDRDHRANSVLDKVGDPVDNPPAVLPNRGWSPLARQSSGAPLLPLSTFRVPHRANRPPAGSDSVSGSAGVVHVREGGRGRGRSSRNYSGVSGEAG